MGRDYQVSVKCCVLTCYWFSSLFEDGALNWGRGTDTELPFPLKAGRTGATWGRPDDSRGCGDGGRICSSSDEAPNAFGSVPLLPRYFWAIVAYKSESPILKLLSLNSGSTAYPLLFRKLPCSSHLKLQTGSSHLQQFLPLWFGYPPPQLLKTESGAPLPLLNS